MATTRESFFQVLKSIEAKLDSTSRRLVVSGSKDANGPQLKAILTQLKAIETTLSVLTTINTSINDQDADINQTNLNTNTVETKLQTIADNLDSGGNDAAQWLQFISDHLKSGGTDNIHTLLDDAIVLLDTLDGNTNGIESRLDHLSSDSDHLSSDLDDIKSALSDVNAELDSIDDNWNLLGVNSLALLAIAQQTLGNSTEDKQDDVITKLGLIDSVLDDIESRVDGLETLQTTTINGVATVNTTLGTTNTKLDSIETDTSTLHDLVGGRRYIDADEDGKFEMMQESGGSDDMTVDGSSSSKSFFVTGHRTIERIVIILGDTGNATRDKFGALTALANGCLLRKLASGGGVIDDYTADKPWTTNFEISLFTGEIQDFTRDEWVQRLTFWKNGGPVRLGTDEKLEILIQDDLTGLDVFCCMTQGFNSIIT